MAYPHCCIGAPDACCAQPFLEPESPGSVLVDQPDVVRASGHRDLLDGRLDRGNLDRVCEPEYADVSALHGHLPEVSNSVPEDDQQLRDLVVDDPLRIDGAEPLIPGLIDDEPRERGVPAAGKSSRRTVERSGIADEHHEPVAG